MKGIIKFFKEDIWHAEIAKMPQWKAILYRILRVLILTAQGFTKSQIQQGASSLTYYSLFAVVPIIALLIGVARGFLFEKGLEAWLIQHFSEQKDIIHQIVKFANTSLEQARGGVIAGIGVAILIWAGIKILTNIELVMNQIWEVKKGRSLARRFTDYFAMVFIAPIIVFLASGFTGFISASISAVSKGKVFEQFASFLTTLLSGVSFLLIAFLFTFLYIFMPNTRVRFLPALIAGIITAIIYQLLQWLYFYFQIGVASYNAIYGTFAAFPLFLVWLHLSWVIVLMGAKLCFAIQNVDAYEFIGQDVALSYKDKIIGSLRIAHLCIKRQLKELSPPTLIEISNLLSIPLYLTTKLTSKLVEAGVLSVVKQEEKEDDTFQPAKSIESLTLKRVIDMLNSKGATIPLPPSPELSLIINNLNKFNAAIEKSDGNVLLKDI